MKRALQLTFIVVLTAFLIWLFLRNANLDQVGRILRGADVRWIAVAALVNLSTLLFRSFRWRAILDPNDPPPFYATFFANGVGYMLSTVLPIRAADVARPALLARRSTKRFSSALGTVLTERMLDLVSILVLFLTFVALRWRQFMADPQTAEWWKLIVVPAAIASVAVLIALAFFVVGVLVFAERVRRFHVRLARFVPQRWRTAWMNLFDAFVQSLRITHDRRAFVVIIASTIAIWACLTLQFTFTAMALHVDLPFDSAFFVTGATTVSMALPTPGGIGGMHKVAELVLMRFYGFAVDPAVAAAVLFHLVGSGPVVILGLLLIVHEHMPWRELRRPPPAQ